MALHLNTGGPKTWHRRIAICPECKHRGRIVGWSQQWYTTIWTCCNCGDSWSGGERLPRPFMRSWRKEAVRLAKRQWVEAT